MAAPSTSSMWVRPHRLAIRPTTRIRAGCPPDSERCFRLAGRSRSSNGNRTNAAGSPALGVSRQMTTRRDERPTVVIAVFAVTGLSR